MKQVNLDDDIYAGLSNEQTDLVQLASRLGIDALPSLKKIIHTNEPIAARALLLEKMIRLFWDIPVPEKAEKRKKEKFMTGMRSIATNSPENQIKGFGSDMLRGKK